MDGNRRVSKKIQNDKKHVEEAVEFYRHTPSTMIKNIEEEKGRNAQETYMLATGMITQPWKS